MSELRALKQEYVSKLTEVTGIKSEAVAEFELLLKKICHFSSKDILLDKQPDAKQCNRIKNILKIRTTTRKPIQQIIGIADFMGDEYFVNEYTLIPRQETELLALEAINILNKNSELSYVLDIGTGSGCIACAVAKSTNSEVIGVDISNKALKIAMNNAEKLKLIKKVMLRKSDIFSNVTEKFDMIVSNPPYIPYRQKPNLEKEVIDYEPACALFAEDENGIDFYKKTIFDAPNYLKKDGYLLFEIGINQQSFISDILAANNFEVKKIINDFSDIPRVIVSQKLK